MTRLMRAFGRITPEARISHRPPGWILVLVAFATLAGANRSYAQGQLTTAALTGQVLDPSGAIVPGATLTLQRKDGGAPIATTSNDTGYYRFELLRPGSYEMKVTKAGFSEGLLADLQLGVNQTASFNITLQPGKLTQEIEVSASALALQTQTSSLGANVSSHQAMALPLLLRDPTQLVNLTPGVTNDLRGSYYGEVTALESVGRDNRLAFSINGGQRQMATEVVDGVDVTYSLEQFPETPLVISPDFLQEMKVHTNNLSAEFGRGAGVVNIVTKSGTNQFHGAAYEFLQNSVLNANDLFSNRLGQKKPTSKRNQYGFAVGGPVIKDKTFFFVDWEQLRRRKAQVILTTVPTAAQSVGDFSSLINTAGQRTTLYNPFDTSADGTSGRTIRNPFPNNVIPASMQDTFGKNLIKYYPTPNNPGLVAANGQPTGINDLYTAGASPINFDRFDTKIDHELGSKNRIMGRFSQTQFRGFTVDVFHNVANPLGLSQRDYKDLGRNVALSVTSTLSPSLIMIQSVNWTRDHEIAVTPSLGFDPTPLGGPFADGRVAAYAKTWAGGTSFPNINVTGWAPMGDGGVKQNYDHRASAYGYQFMLAKTKRSHTLKFGFQFGLNQMAESTMVGYSGAYNYTGGFTAGPDPLTPTASTGTGLADLLLGTLGGGDMTTGWTDFQSNRYFAWFVQDDWRVTPRLTLNLGLRYDFETPFVDRFNHLPRLDLTRPNPIGEQVGPNTNGQTLNQFLTNLGAGPITGAILFASSPGVNGRQIAATDYKGVQPRLGFAYSVTKNLVLRGGFSKLNFKSPGGAQLSAGASGGGLTAATPITGSIDGIHPAVTTSNPFPGGFLTPTYDTLGLLSGVGLSIGVGNINDLTPYQWQWNGGFEYALKMGVVSIAYAGSRSHHLSCPYYSCGNQVPPARVAQVGSSVLNVVPNPFSGIITNAASPLSRPTVQLGQLLKMNPQYTGWSNVPGVSYQGPGGDTFQSAWDALEIGLKAPSWHNASLMVAYTLSKNITNSDASVGGYLGPVVSYQNNYDFKGERSLSAEDVPQRLVIGHVYELPFGAGKRFAASTNRVVQKIVGGWQWGGVITFQSGFPLGISETGHTTGLLLGTDRPNLVGNGCIDSGVSRGDKIQQYLLPAGFQAPPNFVLGNAPRTLRCRADGQKNYDTNLTKTTKLTERIGLEFRAEAYNVFNRPQLGIPNTQFQGASFGRITAQYNAPRTIQFGLKLLF